MTNLALAPAGAAAPAAGPTTAAELAARIPVPRQLPPRCDGEPIRHLSNSSYTLFLACPEAWRLKYLQRKKEPASGAMFLGSRVDDALSLYYRQILDHGERLDLAQVKDAYRDLWQHRTPGRGTAAKASTGKTSISTPRSNSGYRRSSSPSSSSSRSSANRSPCNAGSSSRSRPGSRSGRSSATSTSKPAPALRAASRSTGSSTTRSKATRSESRRPTATRRPAFTSPAGGSRADPLRSSPSLRSPGPAASADR